MSDYEGLILYDDQSDDIIFSGPEWDEALTNMQDPRLSKVARSVDLNPDNTKFFIAFPNAITIPGLFFIGTNLTKDATWRITAYDDDGFSLQIYTSGIVQHFPSGMEIKDYDNKGTIIFGIFGEDITAAYFEVEIFDPTNPAGCVEVAKAFAGKRAMLSSNFIDGAAFKRDPNTVVTRAIAGTPYFSRHKNIRTATLGYRSQDWSVAWDTVDDLQEQSGLDRHLFLMMFPEDVNRLNQHSFLCTLATMSDLQCMAVSGGTLETRIDFGFELQEYVG